MKRGVQIILKRGQGRGKSAVRWRAPALGLVFLIGAFWLGLRGAGEISPLIAHAGPPGESQAEFTIRNLIDRVILARLKEAKVPASGACSDDEFIRRVFLDVLGVIPNREEVKTFLADKSPAKHAELVDRVLESDRYGPHWAVMWGDLLREHFVSEKKEGTIRGSYRDWLREALNANMPYDQFVTSLITAEGTAEDNGAVNFYLRDARERTETANMISSVFMGTRMSCAQCHDHPFAQWEQKDFHSLMAFLEPRINVVVDQEATLAQLKNDPRLSAAIKERIAPILAKAEASYKEAADKRSMKKGGAKADAMAEKDKDMGFKKRMIAEVEKELGNKESQLLQGALNRSQVFRLLERQSGEYRMPMEGDSQDRRQKGGEVVEPVFPWDPNLKAPESGSRREALAKFIVSNPQFAEVQVNRIWHRLFGRGLVHPVDDFRKKNPPSHPEILQFLADEFVKAKFDTKHVLRLILNSNTYRRSTMALEENKSDEVLFSHQKLRRMTGEQLFDSILVATGRGEGLRSVSKGKAVAQMLAAKGGKNMGPVQWSFDLPTPSKDGSFLSVFNQPDRDQVIAERSDEGSILQALELLNGQSINDLVAARGGSLTEELVTSTLSGIEAGKELYLATFSRYPNEKELKVIQYMFKDGKPTREIVEDFQWALLNSREFLFVK